MLSQVDVVGEDWRRNWSSSYEVEAGEQEEREPAGEEIKAVKERLAEKTGKR